MVLVRGVPLLIALLAALSGCLSSGGSDPLTGSPAASALALPGAVASAPTWALWNGSTLRGADRGWSVGDDPAALGCVLWSCAEDLPECTAANCERVPFEVLAGASGVLEVSIRWLTDYHSWLLLHVEDAAGVVVAKGANSGYAYSVAQVALLPDPEPGNYTAVVLAAYGETSYELVVQLEEPLAAAPTRELLPNLVTMPPTDLRIETPAEGGYGPIGVLAPARALADRTGSRGCGLEEVVDHQHQRCLRFSNSVGNVGEGPLEVRLSVSDGATSAAGGRFVQRVFSTDGSPRDVDAGRAEFHAYHGHFHNAAANHYGVYLYDEATGVRGDEVGVGRKGGVCLANVGLVDLGLPHTAVPRWNGTECLLPVAEDDEFAMGLAPNWYDEYPWILSDQYVDVSDVEDGTYALCTVTNQDRTLLEDKYEDNEGCAFFRLNGLDVEVISEEPYNKEAEGV